jgi:glycoside/pentoside/hexuronide:cation symporter, GPH family
MITNTAVKKFGLRDKVGYAFGDLANNLTFVISAVFLLKFYTDVMGVSAGLVGLMMMVGRIFDAFTDITMGQIVDRSRPTVKGKFAPWLRRMCGPIAVATVLLFPVWFKEMPMGFKVFWMFFSYLLWGSVCYTAINIPYGSMASAISDNPDDRSSLSTWRTVGATVGIMLVGVILPMFVFYKNEAGKTILSPEKLTAASVVFAILMVVCYLISYHLTTERVKVDQLTKKFSLKELVSDLVHNRPLIGIIVVALLLLLTQLSLTGTGAYIYPNYFGSAGAFSVSILLGTIITFAFTPFAVKLSTLFGKKELSLYSGIISAASLFILFFLHTKNLAVWFVLYTIGYAGIAFFSLVCWAMITDVIDATELNTHQRADGTVYSIYSFARKLGQAASSGLIGGLLSVVGYSAQTAFDQPVVNGIYAITCLIPAIGYIFFCLAVAFLYPLSKRVVSNNAEKLRLRRNSEKKSEGRL